MSSRTQKNESGIGEKNRQSPYIYIYIYIYRYRKREREREEREYRERLYGQER